MNDCSVTRELVERWLLRDAFKDQHCEGVYVGTPCRAGVFVFDEFGGSIPDNLSGHRLRARTFGALLYHRRYFEIANLWFALTNLWSAHSSPDVNIILPSER